MKYWNSLPFWKKNSFHFSSTNIPTLQLWLHLFFRMDFPRNYCRWKPGRYMAPWLPFQSTTWHLKIHTRTSLAIREATRPMCFGIRRVDAHWQLDLGVLKQQYFNPGLLDLEFFLNFFSPSEKLGKPFYNGNFVIAWRFKHQNYPALEVFQSFICEYHHSHSKYIILGFA